MTRNYLVLTLTAALYGVAGSVCDVYFSLYILGLGGSEFTIGLITGLSSASWVLSAIVGGHIADRYGRKKLVGLMTLMLGLNHFLFAISPNWQLLVIAVVLRQICYVYDPAFFAMLADSIAEKRRGVAFSAFSFLTLIPAAVMPFIGGYLIDVYGVLLIMRYAYTGLAVWGISSGLIRLAFLKETAYCPEAETAEKPNPLRNLGRIIKEAFKEQLRTWSWMSAPALALAFSYALWAFEYGLVGPFWIVYAETFIGLTSTEWGAVIIAGNIIGLGMKITLVGRVLDKFGRRKVLLVIMIPNVFTYLLFIRCVSLVHVLALWVASSFLWSFYDPAYLALEADLIPKERRGRAFSALGVAWSALSIPASLLGGLIYERINPQLSFILAAAILVLCFTVTALFIRVPSKTKEKP